MTTPALRALKLGLAPDRPRALQPHLTLLTTPAGAAVADHVAEVDRVIAYDAPWLRGANTHDATADRRLVSRLDAADYDAAVIFTSRGESALPAALLCMMADIPLRLAHSADNPHRLLTDWVMDDEECSPPHVQRHAAQGYELLQRHEVQRQLDLVATVGAHTEDLHLGFALNDQDRASLLAKLKRRGVDLRRPWLVLHPGALSGTHDDAFEQYLATVQGIQSQLACQVVLTGSGQEVQICEALQSRVGPSAASLAGELSLGEFGTLIAGSTVLLSNGSASVHIAAAVGTPVVDLQSRMLPQQTPWRVPSRVLLDAPGNAPRPVRASESFARPQPREMIGAVCELWQEHAGQHRRLAAGLPTSVSH